MKFDIIFFPMIAWGKIGQSQRKDTAQKPEPGKALKQPDAVPSRRDIFRWLVPILLAAGSFFLLYGFRAAAQTGDSLNYAYSIKTGTDLFHPHHLLFNPIIRLLFVFFSSSGRTADVIAVAQIHNILWAITAILAIYFLIRYLMKSIAWGAAAACLLLVTKGFWTYSTQVQVYVPAMGCLAVLTALLILRAEFVRTVPGMLAVSLLFSLSIFFHQSSILFAIPMTFLLMADESRLNKKTLAVILSLSGCIVLLAYVLAFLSTAGGKALSAFVRFCLSYVFYPNPDWATLKNASLKGVGHLVLSQAKNFIFFSRAWYVPASIGLAVCLSGLGIWHALQIRKKGSLIKIRIFSWLWLLPVFIFLLWYSPGAYELMIVTILPIQLLVFLGLGDIWPTLRPSARKIWAGAGVLLVLVLGWVNFRRAILPAHDSRGPDYDEAKLLSMGAPRDAVIFTSWYVQQHLRYYFERGNALEADVAMFCFYRSLPLPKGYSLDRTSPIVISPAFLYPEAEISKVVRLDGYRNPSEWLRFLEWLFQFEYDSERRLISCRSFEAVNLGLGYLSLSPARMHVDGLGDLMAELEAQTRSRLSDPVPHFTNWLRKNPGLGQK